MTAEIHDPTLPPRKWRPGEGFEPNSWAQERFLVSRAPELLYSGHRGSSKSRTICEKADWLCRTIPGAKIVLSRKKREHMGKTTLQTLLTEVISPSHRAWGWSPGADGGSTLYYPNGSEILCAGLDNPGRMLSGEFMANFTDQAEELDEDEFTAIGGSLRQRRDAHGNDIPFQQNGMACNPGGTGHFLFRRFRPDKAGRANYVQRSEKATRLLTGEPFPAGRVLRECIVAGLEDNAENLPPAYQAWLQSLTGRYRDRFVLGLWVAFEGSLFDFWDDRIHVRPKPAEWDEWGGYPPPTWKRIRSVDFGYTAPFVLQWWARSPETQAWWMYREIYRSQRLVAAHAMVAKAQEALELGSLNTAITRQNRTAWPRAPLLERISWSGSYADHADAEARAQLAGLGFSTSPAIKDRDAGYQTLYEALSPRLNPVTNEVTTRCYFVEGARCEPEDPHLVHAGKPTSTAAEFPLLKFKPEPTSATKGTEEGNIKRDDHGYDAARYALHTFFAGGAGDVVLLR